MSEHETRIEAVVLRIEADECSDLSDLGEFTDKWEPGAIDRQKAGTWSRNEFRYFVPAAWKYKGCTKAEVHKYARQDWRRAEAGAQGEWSFVGVWAEAVVYIGGVRQVLSSGGLWGIESDAGDYLEEVVREEVAELRGVCEAVGIGAEAFDGAEVREPRHQDAFGIVAGTVLREWEAAA